MKITFAAASLALTGYSVVDAMIPSSASSLRGTVTVHQISHNEGDRHRHDHRALQQVEQQLCIVQLGPHTYHTVNCDGNFFSTCGATFTCSDGEFDATSAGEEACGAKFTLLELSNSPSCPWQYQCC